LEKKDILLITYYFPPQQTPRAFRWEIIVNFLINKGYKIDILLPKYNSMPRPELKNVEYCETRQGVIDNFFYKKFYKTKSHRIKNLFKKICSILFNIFVWPDSSIIWYLFAKKELKRMIKNNRYNCIISSAMPFTSHLLGYYAKKQLKIKWIAEYGDPFSFNPQPLKSIFNFLNGKIEKNIIKEMDYIVVPFEGSKEGFLINFPFFQENKIKVIPQIMPSLHSDPGKINWDNFEKSKINIVYAGTFYIPIRSPKILLEALVKLREKDVIAYHKLRFHIFGSNMGGKINKLFNEYQQLLKDKIIILYGETSRESCAFAYEKADYLLNIANISEYQLPSKLIEYLYYKKPIISLENTKKVTLNWPFLIKVSYRIDILVKVFKEISKDNLQFLFNGYDEIIEQYNYDNITSQYLDLV
jgi:hypothetical protein